MSNLGIPSAQRARTKTSDLSEIFRSAHGSRHSSKPGVVTLTSASEPAEKSKSAVTKPRRSMLPFLGRKKPTEQPAASAARKSSNGPSPVNTIRRSFGNGHTVLMITPASSAPPLPSTLPPLNVSSPSLGSKFAAHFTPLRSPSRNTKSRHSMPQKAVITTPPMPCPVTLSPPVPDVRAASIKSQRSSMQSRSTTPRPLRGPRSSAVEDSDDEDFSDLFTLPHQLQRPYQFAKSASTPALNINVGYSGKKSAETCASSTPPASPCLQFPIPPSTVGRPSLVLTERGPIRSSRESNRKEIASLSSQGSRSPSKIASAKAPRSSPVVVDSVSDRLAFTHRPSEDQRRRNRTASYSGSDTDASRAYESSSGPPSFKHTISLSKPSNMKSPASYQPNTKKATSGPPPSLPLPSPPLSPPGARGLAHSSATTTPQINSIASRPSTRLPGVSRPRATTLSITSNLIAPANSLPKPNLSAPHISGKASTTIMADATADELRDALVLQRKKYSQLQEYVVTVTKRYEDDRMASTRTIEKLERDIRRKTREIEGLRWLVIHNGAVGDIDAAANLARSSLSTQDDRDGPEGGRLSSSPSLTRSRTLPQAPVQKDRPHAMLSSSHSMPGKQGLGIHFAHTKQSSSGLEVPSETATSSAASSQTSLSLMTSTSSATSALSAIPEQPSNISRAERQKAKEERRATRALRRISASSVSTLSSGTNLASHLSTPDHSFDPNSRVNQSMDEVLEKLRPFGNA
ncbi:hypothetical protein PAXRUDRAFT_157918 [Paxillus rubicundulus Ve08.2h10]|uniref:Uncharacterized protein n=1 Tax=Paxillus rubicundulus Ve08.2h10 TaxID=930991 RepID=A0A0D0DA19_9AGAM|nr:hypothetical protein PAXRUDRAFT_157918 [Paxillus rubicundulus Ve08.2h10]